MMKKINKYIILSLLALSGCQSDENVGYGGEGTLRLGVQMKNDLQVVVTRSLTADEESALVKDCKIRIYDTDKLIRKYLGTAELPEEGITLPSGEYRVRVTAGDSVAASFTKKFYEGVEPFTVERAKVTPVDVICNIANTVTKVAFGESLKTVFKEEYAVSIAVKAENGILDFNADNLEAMGYFSLPADCDTLFCTFSATDIAGRPYTQVDTIPQAKAATLYQLTYEYKDIEVGNPDTGGAILHLRVDATPLEIIEEEVVYYRRPVFTAAYGDEIFNLDATSYVATESGSDVTINITGSSALQQVLLSSEQFPEFLATSENSFDLKNLTEEQKTQLTEGGILIDENAESKGYALNLILSADLIRKYTVNEGTYAISLTATDANNKMRTANWKMVVSDATVQTEPVPVYEVWATKATLYGTVLPGREPQGALAFRYRKADEQDWKIVDAVRDGQNVQSASAVTGLLSDTKYEYQLMDGDVLSTVVCTFTTEKALQLENSSFEYWSGSMPAYIATSSAESDIFWDSGNHGSKSASVDITVADASIKHSGKYSAKLTSTDAKVLGIGQFAAGNLFAGRYLKTIMDGLKGNGVLGWGRPFTARPSALRVYVKYRPEVVTNNALPEQGLISGEPDQGIIYVAVGDWPGTGSEYISGYEWAVVAQTDFNHPENTRTFDPNDENIIAYGERIFTEDVGGDTEMAEIIIPLDYRDNTRLPKYIVMVASSSRYGDYFAGAVGSIMWIDDVELVY